MLAWPALHIAKLSLKQIKQICAQIFNIIDQQSSNIAIKAKNWLSNITFNFREYYYDKSCTTIQGTSCNKNFTTYKHENNSIHNLNQMQGWNIVSSWKQSKMI